MKENSQVRGNVFMIDEETGRLINWTHNVLTEKYKEVHAKWLVGDAPVTPSHIALGNVAALTTETAREFTALKSEFHRASITSKIRVQPDTARLLALFTSGNGTGEINEVGLFNAAENTDVVSAANATTNWTSDSTLTLDTAIYREGTGSLKAVGTGAVGFRNELLAVGATGQTEASGYFQLWYFIDDVSKLPADGLFVELSSSTSDDTNEYQWNVAKANLANNWNWLNLKLSEATKTGSPNLEALVRVRVFASAVKSASVTERIDHLRLFTKTGDLFARAEPTSTITKGQNQVVGIYWFITATQGGAEVAFDSFAKESLTITTSSTTLTSATYAPTGAEAAKRATIIVTKSPIRYWLDGSTPTSTAGMLAMPLTPIQIDGGDIANFKAIRDEHAVENAVLEVSYER